MFRFFKAAIRTSRLSQDLYGMSDRDLTDIGITRGDIPHILKESLDV